MLIARSETLSRQRELTICTCEAFTVKGLIFVSDSALRDDLHAFRALGGEMLLIAAHTVDLVLLGYEAFRADRVVAREAKEAVFVELLALVFHFFHSRLEYLSTLVTSGSKSLVVALATVEGVIFGAERLVDQRQLANIAEKALFVPVLFFVRQVLEYQVFFLNLDLSIYLKGFGALFS
jgi:hypothetical protein